MKQYPTLLILILLCLSLPYAAQNNVLVIDYNNSFSSDQSNNGSRIYNRLVATQTSVTRINAIPTVINTAYDEVWIFGNMGVTTGLNLNPVVNYINAGGAVYVQSEISCCPNQAAFVDNLINVVTTVGGLISHSVTKVGYYQYVPNPTVHCSTWPPSYGAYVRPFIGSPAANVFFEANNVCGASIPAGEVIGVKFSACDMVSGQGGLISTGDFNIFPTTGTCSLVGMLNNINNFNTIDLIANTLDSLLICSSTCSVLPIELLSFKGEGTNFGNKLHWTTTTEINNNYFSLERSTNAIEFETIKNIAGAGNSTTVINYSFLDENPSRGINYYRLKQTDFDGAFTYSKIISIENENSSEIFIYPNPATSHFNISGIKTPFNVTVIDLLGKIQLETFNEHEIINNGLAAGTYIVVISTENQYFRKKLIIN